LKKNEIFIDKNKKTMSKMKAEKREMNEYDCVAIRRLKIDKIFACMKKHNI
jgi:hypothetical protein